METPAVTEAPAVSKATEHSNFIPTDENYRLTGKRSSEAVSEERKEKSVEIEEKSSSIAAASEAAIEQEKGPAQTKTETTSESRWAKITRENKELREWKAQRERDDTARTSSMRETKQEPQPAKEEKTERPTEPQIDDVDDKGQAKYATLADYNKALSKWIREEAVRDAQEMLAKTERDRAQQQTDQLIKKTVNDRVQAARKAYTDYDDVMGEVSTLKDEMGRDAFFYTEGSHLDAFFLDSDKGQDVMYHIAKNFDDYQHIFARDEKGNYILNPVRQLRELAKIENSLEKETKAPVQRVTQAPRPPHQVSGKSAVTKDAVEDAVEQRDFTTYKREADARDPRLQAVLARRGKG